MNDLSNANKVAASIYGKIILGGTSITQLKNNIMNILGCPWYNILHGKITYIKLKHLALNLDEFYKQWVRMDDSDYQTKILKFLECPEYHLRCVLMFAPRLLKKIIKENLKLNNYNYVKDLFDDFNFKDDPDNFNVAGGTLALQDNLPW